MATSTIPAFKVQSINATVVSGSALELNIPCVDAAGALVDLTSGSAPGPWTVNLAGDDGSNDPASTSPNIVPTKGNGFMTVQLAEALMINSYNVAAWATDVTGLKHLVATGVIRVVGPSI